MKATKMVTFSLTQLSLLLEYSGSQVSILNLLQWYFDVAGKSYANCVILKEPILKKAQTKAKL